MAIYFLACLKLYDCGRLTQWIARHSARRYKTALADEVETIHPTFYTTNYSHLILDATIPPRPSFHPALLSAILVFPFVMPFHAYGPLFHAQASPAQRLPPEILMIIFDFIHEVHDTVSYEDNPNRKKDAMMTLLHASQVCYRWREVAHRYPHPWAQLILPDFQHPLLLEAFMTRARSAPLSVESDCGTGINISPARFATPAWFQILDATERIQSLRVSFDLKRKDEIWPIEIFVMKAAPLLQSCMLNCTKFVEHPHPPGANFLGPSTPLFEGNAKALRCLSIHSCLLPHRADFSGLSLTHLHLEMGSISTFVPTLSEWLDLLSSQPLKFLGLLGFRSRPSMTNVAQVPSEIQLPRLESLYLEGNINDFGELFGALVLPPTCIVHLEVDQYSESSFDGMRAGLERFLTKWDQHNGSSQVYHWLLETSDDMFRLEVSDTGVGENCFSQQLIIECQLFIDIPLEFVLPSFLATLTSSSLMKREAFIRFGPGVDPLAEEYIQCDLVTFLSAFHNATSLMLSNQFIDYIIPCILVQQRISIGEAKENESPALLPNLKRIVLENQQGPADECSLIALRSYLQWRYKRLGKAVSKVLLIYPEPVAAPSDLKVTDFYAQDLCIELGTSELGQVLPPACEHCNGH